MWLHLDSISQIDAIIEKSHQVPCLIFKHSSRCNISSIARLRLESDWPFSDSEVEPYFLDLIRHRDVSNYIAERFEVWHESPQILLIINGDCIFDASHLDITLDEIREHC
jgi:bacillithiol system protein YtxJ